MKEKEAEISKPRLVRAIKDSWMTLLSFGWAFKEERILEIPGFWGGINLKKLEKKEKPKSDRRWFDGPIDLFETSFRKQEKENRIRFIS